MAPSITSLIIVSSVVLHGLSHQVSAKQQPLCADKSGIFLGLAIDEESYASVSGKEGEPRSTTHWHRPAEDGDSVVLTPAQTWTLTEDKTDGPKNSIGGKYLQVLPASFRTYPSAHGFGHGKHMMSLSDIDKESPYLSFLLRVQKGSEGWHSLFVRWTGGEAAEWHHPEGHEGGFHHHDRDRDGGRGGGDDGKNDTDSGRGHWDGMRPGGDSFYAVMKHKDKIVPGERTIKPAVEPISDAETTTYAGCCFDRATHACTCEHVRPDEEKCPGWSFIDVERAKEWGKECPVGQGVMDLISAPEWYLFSGKEDLHVSDFADEPWDTTCEANGSYTHHDSGHDFPSWYLEEGDYDLRIYAREDGTAIDGIYVAGPDSIAPGITEKFSPGDSTLCSRASGGLLKTIGIVTLVGVGLAGLLAFVTRTEAGEELAHQGKMMINGVFYRNSPEQDSIRGYEQMGQLEVGTFQVS